MENRITLEVLVERVMFLAEDDSPLKFGIYSVSPIDPKAKLGHIKLSPYGNFSIKGKAPELEPGERITLRLGQPIKSKGYPDSYEYLGIEPPKLDTVESQYSFLKTITTENQFTNIQKVFPNEKIIDFILADKLKKGDVYGMGDVKIQELKEKIEKHTETASLIVLLEEYGFTSHRLKSITNYFGNDAKLAYAEIRKNIYCLTDIRGWGFKTVDNIVLNNGIPHSPVARIASAIEYIVKQEISQGHTWIGRDELLAETCALANVTRQDAIKGLDIAKVFMTIDDRVTLESVYRTEKAIAKELERINNSAKAIELSQIEEALKDVEEVQGFEFTEEQKQAIINVGQHGVSVITGSAGTGKSATVKGITETLGEYIALALSGRAVDVLESRGVKASTIHRALKIKPGAQPEDLEKISERIVIVDEFSMINASLYLTLLRQIQNGSHLVLVGDHGQLPAIGYGDISRDLITTEHYSVTHLTKIHRQALDSGIIEVAHKIRNGEQITPYHLNDDKQILQFGKSKDTTVIAIDDKEIIPQTIVDTLLQYRQERIKHTDDILNLQIIAPMKSNGLLSVDSINEVAQQIFNPQIRGTEVLQIGNTEYRINDKVMISGNSYEMTLLDRKTWTLMGGTTNIYNGAMGIVRDINVKKRALVIDFPREKGMVIFAKDELENVSLSYCATVHKLQGSSAREILFLLDYSSYVMLSKQLAYVGVTRAEKNLIMIMENKALHKAISTDASSERRTFLKDYLVVDKDE